MTPITSGRLTEFLAIYSPFSPEALHRGRLTFTLHVRDTWLAHSVVSLDISIARHVFRIACSVRLNGCSFPPPVCQIFIVAMARASIFTVFSRILVHFLLATVVRAQFTCSASSPCPEGCCSNFGNCGYGPDFCAATNCTSSCNVKSQCDPGGWGSQYSESSVCPLKVCCSPYGFCGTTTEFCGSKTVPEPSCSGSSATGRTIGYYEGWAVTRNCDSKSHLGLKFWGLRDCYSCV